MSLFSNFSNQTQINFKLRFILACLSSIVPNIEGTVAYILQQGKYISHHMSYLTNQYLHFQIIQMFLSLSCRLNTWLILTLSEDTSNSVAEDGTCNVQGIISSHNLPIHSSNHVTSPESDQQLSVASLNNIRDYWNSKYFYSAALNKIYISKLISLI